MNYYNNNIAMKRLEILENGGAKKNCELGGKYMIENFAEIDLFRHDITDEIIALVKDIQDDKNYVGKKMYSLGESMYDNNWKLREILLETDLEKIKKKKILNVYKNVSCYNDTDRLRNIKLVYVTESDGTYVNNIILLEYEYFQAYSGGCSSVKYYFSEENAKELKKIKEYLEDFKSDEPFKYGKDKEVSRLKKILQEQDKSKKKEFYIEEIEKIEKITGFSRKKTKEFVNDAGRVSISKTLEMLFEYSNEELLNSIKYEAWSHLNNVLGGENKDLNPNHLNFDGIASLCKAIVRHRI